jgi:hypothetical protein
MKLEEIPTELENNGVINYCNKEISRLSRSLARYIKIGIISTAVSIGATMVYLEDDSNVNGTIYALSNLAMIGSYIKTKNTLEELSEVNIRLRDAYYPNKNPNGDQHNAN